MAGGRRGGTGRSKDLILVPVIFLVLAAGIFAWVKVNNIHSVKDGYNYFHHLSDKYSNCGAKEATWKCKGLPNPNPSGSDNSNGTSPSGAPGGSSSGNSGKSSSNPSTSSGGGTNPGSNGGTSDKGSDQPGAISNPLSAVEYKSLLGKLTSSPANKITYDRGEWKHWIGSPCDTREKVLVRDGKNVKVNTTGGLCSVISGTWIDPYSNKTFTNSRDIDIDHVIPLSYAASHGGEKWSASKKEAFANDTTQLLAVSAAENRSKKDKGPSEYLPQNKKFQCIYARIWVSTASKYQISISSSDKSVLEGIIEKC